MAGGAAGAADVGGWRRPGDVDADGLRRLSAEDWDALAVRRPGAVDAERGSPRRPDDVDDAFRRMSNAEVRDAAIDRLRQEVRQLEMSERNPELAAQARDLIDWIDASAGENILVVDADEYQVTHKQWFEQGGSPTDRGTVNLDTGEILINRAQFGSVEEVMLTVFHEGVHYQDVDTVKQIDREMNAYLRTYEFAEGVGLEYSWVSEVMRQGGEVALRQDIIRRTRMDQQDPYAANQYAVKRKMMQRYGMPEHIAEMTRRRVSKEYFVNEIVPEYNRMFSDYIPWVGEEFYADPTGFTGLLVSDDLNGPMYVDYIRFLEESGVLHRVLHE
jgi:hypothetical protein